MRTYIKWHNTVNGVPNLPAGQVMYWLRPVGGSCDEDRIAFMALSAEQKIAQSTTVPPTTSTSWILRNCGITSGLWVEDLDSGASFIADTIVDDPQTPNGNNPTPTVTSSILAITNRDVFEPEVQWTKVDNVWKARVVNKKAMNGNWKCTYDGVHPPFTALITEYVFEHGDLLEIDIVNMHWTAPVWERAGKPHGQVTLKFIEPQTTTA